METLLKYKDSTTEAKSKWVNIKAIKIWLKGTR